MTFLYAPLFLPVLFSIICGAIIGIDREIKNKDAGIKTNIMIAVGAAVFTFVGDSFEGDYDKARVVSQIVSGVGFIGGGLIIFDKNRVSGITSATIVWIMSSIGVLNGLKMYKEAVLLSITIVIIDIIFDKVKSMINNKYRR